jgi:superfamily I DNA/RNA helicase
MFINPNDDVSLLRIANTPARGLSDVTMERLLAASQEHHCPVYCAMKDETVLATYQNKTQEAIRAFTEFIERTQAPLLEEIHISLQSWADKFIDEIGYLADIRRGEKTPQAADSRVQNLKELIVSLDKTAEAKTPAKRLEEFLDDITLDSDREEDEEVGDAVTLITMHSCKGLEYPHVFVVGMEDGLLPHSRSKIENILDEERRLFYVAMTRAMKTLTLSHCNTRRKYGQALPCHPSPFLKELPEDLLEMGDEKSKTPVTVETGKSLFAAMRVAAS